MNIHEEYQRENEFSEDEKLYYILTGEGGAAMIGKSHKYYVISCTLIAAYDIEEDKLLKKSGIIRWPISTDDYEKQDATSEYFHAYKDGVIYKVRGRQVINYMGKLPILYVKEILETDIHGTKLDKIQEKYLAPILLEDEVLGHLTLEKDSGLFEGSYSVNGQTITIYVEVEWGQKRTWKKPLTVAREFIANIEVKDQQARKYAASDEELFENALECLEDDCEISFSNPEEFAEALKGRLKYIFVNQNGSYTIGYDDGYVFGGHEIDVDVNAKGIYEYYDEAIAVCDLLLDLEFTGNYSIWWHADYTACLKARILRGKNITDGRKELLERVNEHRHPELYINGVDWYRITVNKNIQSDDDYSPNRINDGWRMEKLEHAIMYREAGGHPIPDEEFEADIMEIVDLLKQVK